MQRLASTCSCVTVADLTGLVVYAFPHGEPEGLHLPHPTLDEQAQHPSLPLELHPLPSSHAHLILLS